MRVPYICSINLIKLQQRLLLIFFTGRSSKHKNAKYHSIDSKEGKPSLISTASDTSSESEVSSDEDSGDPSGESRIL